MQDEVESFTHRFVRRRERFLSDGVYGCKKISKDFRSEEILFRSRILKQVHIYIYKTRYFIPVYFPSLLLKKDISRFDREFSISTKSPPLVVIISVTTNDFEFHPYKQFPQAFSAGGTNINTFTSKPNPHHETVAWSHKFMRLNLSFHGELTQWPVEVLAHFSENLPFRTKTLGNVR